MFKNDRIRGKGAWLPDGRAFVIEHAPHVGVSPRLRVHQDREWTLYLVTGRRFEPVAESESGGDADVRELQATAEEMAGKMFPMHAIAQAIEEEGR